jgi:Xaa-Pro aminopeptidase
MNINSKTIHIEKEVVPFAIFERFNKYFSFSNIKSLDLAVAKTRAIKSDFELNLMRKSGEIHKEVLEDIVPTFLKPGISEAELGALILSEKIKKGHQGITRMGSFNAELYLGNICFGENGNYYNSFDGPGGLKGISPAVPLFGSFDRKLKENDILYVDSGTGYLGYHTDKTSVYSMKRISNNIKDMHKKCVDIQNQVAEMLVPGVIPSEIYNKIMSNLDDDFEKNFMGYKSNKVKFLAHSIGLVIDEYPVIAKGFDDPVEENMVFAIEPKNFIDNVGLVGVENTFVVTKKGAKSITGNFFDIIEIG